MTTDKYELAANALADLPSFIQYCNETDESEWQIDTVRNVGNTKNCLFGHLVNWYYGKDYDGNVSPIWDMFEEIWSTTFYVYDVNDGKNPKYQQSTPKQRCVAYLKDLWLAIETPVWRANEVDELNAKKRMENAS